MSILSAPEVPMRNLTVAAVAATIAFSSVGMAQQGRGRGPLGGQQAGFVLNPALDTIAPDLPADFKPGGVLIFSKTNGFREEASIQASNAALAAIATMRGWPSFVTENGA